MLFAEIRFFQRIRRYTFADVFVVAGACVDAFVCSIFVPHPAMKRNAVPINNAPSVLAIFIVFPPLLSFCS